MPFIPVANVAQFNIRATYFGIDVENVMCFRHLTGAITPLQLQTAADALMTAWAAEVMDNLSVSYILREVHAVDLTTATSAIYTSIVSAGATGALIDSPGLPGNIAFCVSLRTAQRGRSFRGRCYLVGLTESRVTENEVPLAWANAVIEDFVAVSDAMIAVDFEPGVVSRFTAGAPRAAGVFTPLAAYVYTDLRVDTQRRRLE